MDRQKLSLPEKPGDRHLQDFPLADALLASMEGKLLTSQPHQQASSTDTLFVESLTSEIMSELPQAMAHQRGCPT